MFTLYCDDGFLRKGVVNKGIYLTTLPEWDGFLHSGMMVQSDKNELVNSASKLDYGIYLYWMIWLYKSPELFNEPFVKSDNVSEDIDYKKEFDDLYEEFKILEDNYDMLKESYDYLREIQHKENQMIEQDLGTEYD